MISSQNKNLFSEEKGNNPQIKNLHQSKTIDFETLNEKEESPQRNKKYHKIMSMSLTNESRHSQNIEIMKEKCNGFILPKPVKELEIAEENDFKEI